MALFSNEWKQISIYVKILYKGNFWYSGSIFAYFFIKVYLILMKLIEISWNFIFWKLMKTLVLKHFEIRWNKWCPNQVLRKLVKHHNSQNVNQHDYINVYRHSKIYSWMSFLFRIDKWYCLNLIFPVDNRSLFLYNKTKPNWLSFENISSTIDVSF